MTISGQYVWYWVPVFKKDSRWSDSVFLMLEYDLENDLDLWPMVKKTAIYNYTSKNHTPHMKPINSIITEIFEMGCQKRGGGPPTSMASKF